MCNGPIPTEGLVGFLSNALTDGTDAGKIWNDEYLGVNATVKNGAAGEQAWGVGFKGAGAGAEWPVGSKGQNQPYYFANNKFTLVATVAIHAVPEEDTPLMGARMNDDSNSVLFELSYTSARKWSFKLHNVDTKADINFKWALNKTSQVILQMNWNQWSVYVDGVAFYEGAHDGTLFDSHRISHFFVGGDKNKVGVSNHHVTVFNVLLYNRLLANYAEVNMLDASKVAIPQLGATKPVMTPQGPPTTGGGGGETAPVMKPASTGDNAPVPAGPPQPPPPSSGEKDGEAAKEQTNDNAAGAAPPGAGAAASGAANPSGNHTPGLGAEAAAPEAAVAPGGSSAANNDAGQAPAKDTSDISPPGAVGVSNGDNKKASQGADNAVGGCVPHVVLLALLGLWGIAALSAA
ncbi:trans-sialidase [Trypanosoma rangeli]|uniref:Trans-sialidase n=1 Tax=Trypanosoma rangeli TaxID=5698 RepID=A0A3R7MU59_TRYRA|nr:trans-sialidase [Trypanosoma rangeli]RNE95335.1 trans-sialidase [Trypanosoma rangeli]|eukprot:RNE95335.1 trans-sialidase [Trypanosoma rangeli]